MLAGRGFPMRNIAIFVTMEYTRGIIYATRIRLIRFYLLFRCSDRENIEKLEIDGSWAFASNGERLGAYGGYDGM